MGRWGRQDWFRRAGRVSCCRRAGTSRGSGPAGKSGPRDPVAEEKGSGKLEAESLPRLGRRRALEAGHGTSRSRGAAAVGGEGGDEGGGGHQARGGAAPGAPRPNAHSPVPFPARAGAAAGRDSKMKLWDVVAVCLVLLHTASAFPLPAGKRPPEVPAEDRSLGRRRAPFALSSDCKNRSLPAGGPPAVPPAPLPAARTHPKPAGTAVPPPTPSQGEVAGGCPKAPPPSPYSAGGIRCLCCPFSVATNRYFRHHHYHHHRKSTQPSPFLSVLIIYTQYPPFFSPSFSFFQSPLSVWVCLAVLNSGKQLHFHPKELPLQGKRLRFSKAKPESEKTQKGLDFQSKHLGSVKSVKKSSGSRKTEQ